ncbi:hypothetical protein QQF64_011630 [Cirrhinus molitorella]|uniref:Uncharacterized protein n=1 Tax=Cirrhinus molitorella TaxID=172907 RepID=A0ABR3M2C9_9TELE
MEVFAVIPSSAVTTQNSSHDRTGCDTGRGRNEDVLVETGLCKMEVVKLSCCINSVVLPQHESTNGSSPAVAVRRRSTTQPRYTDANVKSLYEIFKLMRCSI